MLFVFNCQSDHSFPQLGNKYIACTVMSSSYYHKNCLDKLVKLFRRNFPFLYQLYITIKVPIMISLYPFVGLLLGSLITISDGHPCGNEEDDNTIDVFLEQPLFGVVKVWHLVMIGLGLAIIATIVLCCIMRCRIPRTKQEIEADAVRKKVTKQFRAHLNKISIEGMELIKVLNEVKQYEEDRLKRGTVEEKKTMMQRLRAMFKSDKADSLDRSDVKEDEEANTGEQQEIIFTTNHEITTTTPSPTPSSNNQEKF